MLDVYVGAVHPRTEAIHAFLLDKFGVDDVRVVHAPVEGVQVKEIVLLHGPLSLVLVDQLACDDVAQRTHFAVHLLVLA